MNEIREVAKAYYARATEEEKQLAKECFGVLDANGDGRVSLAEYKSLVEGFDENNRLFQQLDENGDGTLDFEEFLTLYYMEKVCLRSCDACNGFLVGAYFSCFLCEKDHPHTYDLCCNCYGGGRFQHHHSTANFVDDRCMRSMLAELMKDAEITQPEPEKVERSSSRTKPSSRTRSRRESAKEAFEAFNTGVTIGNYMVTIGDSAVSAGCRIM